MGPTPFYRDRELQEDSRNKHFLKVIENTRRPSKPGPKLVRGEREEINVFYIIFIIFKKRLGEGVMSADSMYGER